MTNLTFFSLIHILKCKFIYTHITIEPFFPIVLDQAVFLKCLSAILLVTLCSSLPLRRYLIWLYNNSCLIFSLWIYIYFFLCLFRVRQNILWLINVTSLTWVFLADVAHLHHYYRMHYDGLRTLPLRWQLLSVECYTEIDSTLKKLQNKKMKYLKMLKILSFPLSFSIWELRKWVKISLQFRKNWILLPRIKTWLV